MTIHTIYQHLLATNAPTNFQVKSTKKYRPNISQLTSEQILTEQPTDTTETQQHTEDKGHNNKQTSYHLSTYVLQDDHQEQHYLHYDPTIQAFRHRTDNRPKIICEACGLPGHPASKCFRRGFNFLPRDVQRRISAYNTKYGDDPTNDRSDQKFNRQVLPAPEIKLPQEPSKSPNIQDKATNQATIHKLQHVLPPSTPEETTPNEDIEFLNEIPMHDNTPIIHAISRTQHEPQGHYTHTSTHHTNPLTIDVITDNGEVNLEELHTLQDQLLQPTPINYFKPYRHQYFHIDTGANVHATTDKRYFLIYYTLGTSLLLSKSNHGHTITSMPSII